MKADICRIKFDLTMMVMANPVQSTVETTTTAAVRTAAEGMTGQCATDSFQISGGSGRDSPVICGTNSGQHSKRTFIFLTSLRYKYLHMKVLKHLLHLKGLIKGLAVLFISTTLLWKIQFLKLKMEVKENQK